MSKFEQIFGDYVFILKFVSVEELYSLLNSKFLPNINKCNIPSYFGIVTTGEKCNIRGERFGRISHS